MVFDAAVILSYRYIEHDDDSCRSFSQIKTMIPSGIARITIKDNAQIREKTYVDWLGRGGYTLYIVVIIG